MKKIAVKINLKKSAYFLTLWFVYSSNVEWARTTRKYEKCHDNFPESIEMFLLCTNVDAPRVTYYTNESIWERNSRPCCLSG